VQALAAAPDLDGWAITEQLLADLSSLRDRLWLVIDDVHELDPGTLQQLELLVLRAPPGLLGATGRIGRALGPPIAARTELVPVLAGRDPGRTRTRSRKSRLTWAGPGVHARWKLRRSRGRLRLGSPPR
jgi:hypothetical protein